MKGKQIAALFGAAALLTACGQSGGQTAFSPSETSLYLTAEGRVVSAAVETYEGDGYSTDGLLAYAEGVLAEFNESAKDGQTASVKECAMENGTARLLLEFESPASYLSFMKQYPDEESPVQVKSLDVRPVSEGIARGYVSGIAYRKLSNGKSAASDEIMKQKGLMVAAVEGEALIFTDGAVQYVSDGVSAEGANGVRTAGDGVSYIIFK